VPTAEGGLGPPTFEDDEHDPASEGATITFEQIGAAGSYPSRRDPSAGPCDAYDADMCCMAEHHVDGDALTPWDEDLILTLRGPLLAKQLAVYQPEGGPASPWTLVSAWDQRTPSEARGIAFTGDSIEAQVFGGAIGTECLVDVSTDREFACGDGSVPYCTPSSSPRHYGWSGSKLIVLLATMPHADQQAVGTACSSNNAGNWYDAPWLGLSLGEVVRAGAFSGCNCYAKNPSEWWLGDGCGQLNAFEVVNDNNASRNLDLFSTNFFGYAGYVGEGPCGQACDVTGLSTTVDLVDKASSGRATAGALANPNQGPGVAFRRPAQGYRYFIIHLDVASRTVQLGMVHPNAIPASIAAMLPGLPSTLSRSTIDAVLSLRLPAK
jgi:Tos1-like cell wall protein